MTRLNGSNLHLPQHEAQARQQEAGREAMITALRVQISTNVIGQLLPEYLTRARQRAFIEAGKPADSLDPIAFDAGQAIEGAANLSVAAADKLLSALGFDQQ